MNLAQARTKIQKIVPTPFVDRLARSLLEVEATLTSAGVESRVPGLRDAARSIIQAGGKRLRPVLLLLSGFAGTYDAARLPTAAAAVEMIHTASLVHDDIIDAADRRRGRATLQRAMGTGFAVATGDFMFARAFELVASLREPEVTATLAEAAVELSLGELDGQRARRELAVDRARYLVLIRRKTAALFAAACRVGALLSGASETSVAALTEFGLRLGYAFQIYDDVLDVVGDERTLGKPAGSDLREGIFTLPYIIAVERGLLVEDDLRRAAAGSAEAVAAVLEVVRGAPAAEAAAEARAYVGEALAASAALENEPLRLALESLGGFVVERYA